MSAAPEVRRYCVHRVEAKAGLFALSGTQNEVWLEQGKPPTDYSALPSPALCLRSLAEVSQIEELLKVAKEQLGLREAYGEQATA